MLLSKSILLVAMAVFSVPVVRGADGTVPAGPGLHAALSEAKWQELGISVDRGLAWIATQQAANGSFGDASTPASTQPAVTSLCVMAFLSRGHLPGYGPYGTALNRAIDFVVSCQRPDGLFSYLPPESEHITKTAAGNATYNHAIAGLMLGEVYGHVTGQRMKAVRGAIEKALAFTHGLQSREKAHPEDAGGWRYLYLAYNYEKPGIPADSDISTTAWQLMFLRSARNAEFNVPQSYIDNAMAYVHRSFEDRERFFYYDLSGPHPGWFSRGLVGAGIVSLSLAGEHQSKMALEAGNWLLVHPFRYFGELVGGGSPGSGGDQFYGGDRFYYSTYYCSQAAAQLGGRYWNEVFPALANVVLGAQNPDGSWPIAPTVVAGFFSDDWIGPVFPTAMAVLSLTPAYQLLPVYQR